MTSCKKGLAQFQRLIHEKSELVCPTDFPVLEAGILTGRTVGRDERMGALPVLPW